MALYLEERILSFEIQLREYSLEADKDSVTNRGTDNDHFR